MPGGTNRDQRTAHHEAGHAVLGLGFGWDIDVVSVIPEPGEAGRCRLWRPAFRDPRAHAADEVCVLSAGAAAEAVLLGRDVTADGDYRMALAAALRVCPRSADALRFYRRHADRARQELSRPLLWRAVAAVARELLERGELGAAETRAAVARALLPFCPR
jgi:hypothetical protein